MKIVVYTAIIGDIDRLWSAGPGAARAPHVAFVDAERPEAGLWGATPPMILPGTARMHGPATWEQRVIAPAWDSRRTARHYKACPHRYLPDADVWIWLDGNVRARISPQAVVGRFLGDADFATFNHWERNCLYDEARACMRQNKDSHAVLAAQAKRYRQAGMPQHWGLAATRVVVRRNTPEVCELNEAWWHEMEIGSLRDQVSLPFVFWQRRRRWAAIPGRLTPHMTPGPDFVCIMHGGLPR